MLPDTYIWMKEDLKTTIDRQESKLARNYLLICSFLSLIHVIGEWHPNPWLQYGGTTFCAKRRPKWGWAVNYWMEISAAASFLIYRAGQETASCARRELINRPRFRPFSKHICPRNPFSIHQFSTEICNSRWHSPLQKWAGDLKRLYISFCRPLWATFYARFFRCKSAGRTDRSQATVQLLQGERHCGGWLHTFGLPCSIL